MDEIPGSVPFPGEEELRAKVKRRVRIGLLLLISPIFLLLFLAFFNNFLPAGASLGIFGFIVVGVLSGFVITFYYGAGSKLFFHGLDIIRKISPDEVVLKGRYVVVKTGRVFLVAYWGSNTLFFIAYLHSMPAERQKLDVPGVIWRWEYKINMEGLKIARRQERFTVPISQDEFISGEGILYSLLIESMPPLRVLQYPSRQQILEIASQLDDEASGIGSGTIM
ncbi:MAG: hypothetical protein ACFFEX_10265 [Candidatus Thorarchaeota archaeon]